MKTALSLALATALAAFGLSAFAADVTLESAPPVVVKTIPTAGAKNVNPNVTELRVTFSKRMQDGSWSWSTWSEESYPETTGQPRYLEDERTCALPVRLQPKKFYAIWVNSDRFTNFKDLKGQPAVPYLLTFTTAGTSPASGNPVTGAFEHDVKPGDTLSKIVTIYRERGSDVTIDDVLKANPSLDPARLRVGQRIRIPAGKETTSPSSELKAGVASTRTETGAADLLLNGDQRSVLAWTDRQFRSFFDNRTFEGWSTEEREKLETRLVDALNGPRSTEYYQAINTLAGMRSTKALPRLREIAFERVDRNNRDRWMSVRALGIIGDKTAVPELIHLVYHGNQNTHWWAQITLVRLTEQNFGGDWNAWGKWWNGSGGQPPYNPEIIRWWEGQAEPDKLAESLAEGDQKFLSGLQPQTGQRYLDQQLKLASTGDYWARFNVWEALSKGKHEVTVNSAEADKWLEELVKGAYLAEFEPVGAFNPKTPGEMLDRFHERCQLRSGKTSLGGASFFRTTKQGDKLIGSFLTELPDEFRKAIEQSQDLKLISIEALTPEMFEAHESSRQESL
jgi:RNA polymerase sigma-70 factor (ECF subfamily)